MSGFVPNKAQAEAIAARAGELCVNAGAGSGKTTVVAERFAEAVVGDGVPLGAVLAITFTEKATGELLERVRRALLAQDPAVARAVARAWVCTIHGFCTRLLRRHALEAGLDPEFAVADALRSTLLKREAFDQAMRAALAAREEVRRLVADYGIDVVADAVFSLFDRLVSLGRCVDDVRPTPAPDVASALADSCVTFEALAADLAAVDAPGTTLPRLRASTTSLIEDLRALEAAPNAEDLPSELLVPLSSYRPTHHGAERLKAVAGELADTRDTLVGTCVSAVEAGHASAVAGVLRAFANRYAQVKRAAGVVDFDELQLTARDLLRSRPDLARVWREAFRMVMIDEFQDTDRLQVEILSQVTAGDLCTVGDEKQSIYGFRNADVGLFKAHTSAMVAAGATEVTLRDNYRSHADVLAFVNELFRPPGLFADGFIELVARRHERRATPWPSGHSRVQVLLVDKAGWPDGAWREGEARVLAERVAQLVESGVRPDDTVVLLRSLKESGTYAAAMAERGIPVVVDSGRAYFALPEVMAMRALLGTIVNARDDVAVAGLLASGLVGLGGGALLLVRAGTPPGRCLWDGLTRVAADLPTPQRERAELALAVIERLRSRQGRDSVAGLMRAAIAEFDYDHYLLADSDAGPRARANVLKLVRLADSFDTGEHTDPRAFLDNVAARERFDDREGPATMVGDAGAVRLMSVHKAKGLEFPVVVLADLGHDVPRSGPSFMLTEDVDACRVVLRLPDSCGLPSSQRRSAAYAQAEQAFLAGDRDESARVLYVACTRAKEALILVGSADMGRASRGETAAEWLRDALGVGGSHAEAERDAVLEFGAGVRLSVTGAAHAFSETRLEAFRCAPAAPNGRPRTTTRATSGQTRPLRVSFSDIETYLACPARYQAERELRLPAPPRDDDPRAFGSAVHTALQLSHAGQPPDAERLERIARQFVLEPTGRDRLGAAVERFLASAVGRRLARCRVRTEVPFTVRLRDALLAGTIDALADEDGRTLIVDYKTGPLDRLTAPYALQARCYALAALTAGARAVEVAFVAVESDDPGTLLFHATFRSDDECAIAADVERVAEQISAGQRPRRRVFDEKVCPGCPALGGLCPIDPA